MRFSLMPIVFACAMAAQHANAETLLEQSNRILKEVNEQMASQHHATAINLEALPQPTVSANPADLARQFIQPPTPTKPPATELMIFVSFSMPREALLRIVNQSEKSGARLIFRGFKGDKLTEMAQHIANLIGKHRVEALVHPPAFNQFKITQVPALVIAQSYGHDKYTAIDNEACHDRFPHPNPPPQAGEGAIELLRELRVDAGDQMTDGCAQVDRYVKVTGDVSQDYALDYIERTSPQWATAARFFGDKLK